MTLRPRKQEIHGTTARAQPTNEISRLLFISQNIVRFQTRTIYSKLNVAFRTEASGAAYRQGIVAVDLPIPSVGDVT